MLTGLLFFHLFLSRFFVVGNRIVTNNIAYRNLSRYYIRIVINNITYAYIAINRVIIYTGFCFFKYTGIVMKKKHGTLSQIVSISPSGQTGRRCSKNSTNTKTPNHNTNNTTNTKQQCPPLTLEYNNCAISSPLPRNLLALNEKSTGGGRERKGGYQCHAWL